MRKIYFNNDKLLRKDLLSQLLMDKQFKLESVGEGQAEHGGAVPRALRLLQEGLSLTQQLTSPDSLEAEAQRIRRSVSVKDCVLRRVPSLDVHQTNEYDASLNRRVGELEQEVEDEEEEVKEGGKPEEKKFLLLTVKIKRMELQNQNQDEPQLQLPRDALKADKRAYHTKMTVK